MPYGLVSMGDPIDPPTRRQKFGGGLIALIFLIATLYVILISGLSGSLKGTGSVNRFEPLKSVIKNNPR